jgi:peptide deformylase
MTMEVIQYGHPVLRERGEAVESFDGELARFAERMRETMEAHDGIGLAAHQVGRPVRFCVVDLGRAAPEAGETVLDGRAVPPAVLMPLFLANPRLEHPAPVEVDVMEEGCLSIQGIRGDVTRPFRVDLSFQDLEGAPHRLRCEGLLARCIQHEVDHLNGVLFVDRLERKDFARVRAKLRRLKGKMKAG